jgi:hypothetical protein
MIPPDAVTSTFPAGVWKGIDTAGDDRSPGYVITPEVAAELLALGYRWVARYISLDGSVLDRPLYGGDYLGCYSLSQAEAGWILDAGLGLLLVQWGPRAGDLLTPELGYQRGLAAAAAREVMGLPVGSHLMCDLEGRAAARAGRSLCLAYVKRWAEGGRSRGDLAGAYIGDGTVPLSAQDLHGIPGVTCYWSAAAGPPPNPLPRGYAIEQDMPTTVAGIRCDTDTIRQDRRAQGPVLCATEGTRLLWYQEAMGELARWLAA